MLPQPVVSFLPSDVATGPQLHTRLHSQLRSTKGSEAVPAIKDLERGQTSPK